MKKLIFIISIFTLMGCKTFNPQAMSESQLKTLVNSSDVVLVDVRISEEYAEGTVENAINIPLSDIENHLDFFRQHKKIVVFCNKGFQAEDAEKILKKNGIKNVYNGIGWENVKVLQEKKNE
jgi:rhodanese-related sulfurtransferase